MKAEVIMGENSLGSIHYINGIAVNIRSSIDAAGRTITSIFVENGIISDTRVKSGVVSVISKTRYEK